MGGELGYNAFIRRGEGAGSDQVLAHSRRVITRTTEVMVHHSDRSKGGTWTVTATAWMPNRACQMVWVCRPGAKFITQGMFLPPHPRFSSQKCRCPPPPPLLSNFQTSHPLPQRKTSTLPCFYIIRLGTGFYHHVRLRSLFVIIYCPKNKHIRINTRDTGRHDRCLQNPLSSAFR